MPNRIDRFAIGDRDALQRAPDGSITITIGPEPPAAGEANWLPAPAASGRLGVTMRLYAPKAAVLSGGWAPPPLKRVG